MGYTFSKKNAERIGRAVKVVEDSAPAAAGPGLGFRAGIPPGAPGVTSGTITAKSGTTPGSGNVILDTYNPTTNVLGTGDTVAVKNRWPTSIATGKVCWVYWWAGVLWVVPAEC